MSRAESVEHRRNLKCFFAFSIGRREKTHRLAAVQTSALERHRRKIGASRVLVALRSPTEEFYDTVQNI